MRKYGFTLIELLAVIVILVVIALITTPLILNVINDSKEKARLQSIKNIEDQAYFYYTKYALVNNKATGNLFNPVMEIMKGEKPEQGEIQIKDGKKIAYALKYGNVCYKKGYEESVVRKLENEEECTLVNTKNYLKTVSSAAETDAFLGGPIARNTIEKIVTLGHQEMGDNVIGSWDASEQANNSILAWYKDEDANGLYEVYLGGDLMVVANPNSKYLFVFLTNLIEIDLNCLYTSNVTDMSNMFSHCHNLLELNVDNFDTFNVTNMNSMFSTCNSLIELNLNHFDTSNVSDMSYMFNGCWAITELNIDTLDTSKVTTMEYMFCWCDSLMKLNIENWNTSSVTNMSYMFSHCRHLTELNLNAWDTSKVKNMGFLFNNCSYLEQINIKNWDTSSVTSMIGIFGYCSSLVKLDISNLDTSNVTSMFGAFGNCGNLTELNISNWNNFSGDSMFSKCYKLTTIYANTTIKSKIESTLESDSLKSVTIVV